MRSSRIVVLVAAGILLLVLAARGRNNLSQQTDEVQEQRVKVYSSVEACKAEQSGDVCSQAYAGALQAHETSAPRYDTRDLCEDRYGPAACMPYHQDGHDWFMPAMMGFMLGHALGGSSPIYQPIYIDRYHTVYSGRDSIGSVRDDCFRRQGCASGGSTYVYNTSSGGGSSSVSRLWTNRGYDVQTTTRTVTRGGFGSTASLVASRSSSGLGG